MLYYTITLPPWKHVRVGLCGQPPLPFGRAAATGLRSFAARTDFWGIPRHCSMEISASGKTVANFPLWALWKRPRHRDQFFNKKMQSICEARRPPGVFVCSDLWVWVSRIARTLPAWSAPRIARSKPQSVTPSLSTNIVGFGVFDSSTMWI